LEQADTDWTNCDGQGTPVTITNDTNIMNAFMVLLKAAVDHYYYVANPMLALSA
jgi:hypothetical protein